MIKKYKLRCFRFSLIALRFDVRDDRLTTRENDRFFQLHQVSSLSLVARAFTSLNRSVKAAWLMEIGASYRKTLKHPRSFSSKLQVDLIPFLHYNPPPPRMDFLLILIIIFVGLMTSLGPFLSIERMDYQLITYISDNVRYRLSFSCWKQSTRGSVTISFLLIGIWA